jgi:hypothetical protein
MEYFRNVEPKNYG